jgi:hypothetical protein
VHFLTRVTDNTPLLLAVVLQHPGFDFSGATINGAAPDAHTFMGGISADAKLS